MPQGMCYRADMRAAQIFRWFLGSSLLTLVACSSDDAPAPGAGSGGAAAPTGGTGGLAAGGSGGAFGAGGFAAGGTGGLATGSTTGTGAAAAGGSAGVMNPEFGSTGDDAGLPLFSNIYHSFDEGYSTIMTTAMAGQVCTSGTAAQVVDMLYTKIWGALVGLEPATEMPAEDPTADPVPVDLSTYVGFTYDITTPPSGLRAGVLVGTNTDAFFTTTVAPGTNTVCYADLKKGDWADPDQVEVVDPAGVSALQFLIASNANADNPFDFCVSNIMFIADGCEDAGGTGGAGSGGAGSGGAGTGGADTGGTGGMDTGGTGGTTP